MIGVRFGDNHCRRRIVLLIAGIAVAVALAETASMLLLDHWKITSSAFRTVLDVFLLTAALIPVYYFVIYRRLNGDMTELRETQKALKDAAASLEREIHARTQRLSASEAEMSAVLESSADGILRIDTKGIIHTANQSAHRLLGYKGMELSGQDVSAIIPDDNMRVLVEGYLSYLSGWGGGDDGSAKSLAAEALKKNGARLAVEMTISECIIGSKIYYVLIMRDVTERRKSENALRKSEERFRLLIEHGQLIAWEMDIAADSFTYVSAQAERVLGYPRKEWLAPGFWQNHLYPNDRQGAGAVRAEAIRKKRDHISEYRILALDGSIVWVRDLVSVVWDAGGEVSGLQGFMIDVTERKRAEEKLVAAKTAAEEATKLKDKFVSLVSHDLRGPIGTILGFIKLVERREMDRLGPESRKMLDLSIESGDRMVMLINDLLSMSRLRQGGMTPIPRFIDIQTFVKKIVRHNEASAAPKGIDVKINVPPGRRLYGDETLIGEVMQNLLQNAVKYSRAGDAVAVSLTDDPNPTLAVSDTGVGIPPEKLGSIFSYGPGKSTLGTNDEKGTGLGLPLSHEIMQAHGGRLYVESAPGKGSTFYMQLPCVRPLVLLVDDQPNERELVTQHLKQLDVDIMEASDGLEALDVLETKRPHLIISNVWMPRMNGLELTMRVKENPRFRAIPLVILTADNSMETRNQAVELGADDFAQKPVNPAELFPRVRRFIA